MKKVAIIKSDNIEIIKSIQNYLKDDCVIISKEDDFSGYDLVVLTGYDVELSLNTNVEVINLHPALLPAFKGREATKETFLSGVKVGGITIHKVEKDNFYGKIIAQYPVLIGLTTNYSDYIQELEVISKKLYPIVIDTIIKDKVFDFQDIFKTNHSCGGSCGNCSRR